MVGENLAPEALEQLLTQLRSHGVESFRYGALEVKFAERSGLKNPVLDNTESPADDSKNTTTPEEVDEETLFYSSGVR
jgi:hypothetical protein